LKIISNNFLKSCSLFNPVYLFILISFIFFSCKSTKNTSTNNSAKERNKAIQNKYAQLLNVEPQLITNTALYQLIDEWMGVPYKYGGSSKSGVDCSNFSAIVYSTIYDKKISGSSANIFNQCTIIDKNNLQEGDLLFFKIERNTISHMGIYLINNKFAHATTKKGVMINDLDEDYYKKYFFKAGRLK